MKNFSKLVKHFPKLQKNFEVRSNFRNYKRFWYYLKIFYKIPGLKKYELFLKLQHFSWYIEILEITENWPNMKNYPWFFYFLYLWQNQFQFLSLGYSVIIFFGFRTLVRRNQATWKLSVQLYVWGPNHFSSVQARSSIMIVHIQSKYPNFMPFMDEVTIFWK